MLYDERYHFHLGYYENGYDIETVGLKRKMEPIWDFFFDYELYGLKQPENVSTQVIKGSGYYIFSMDGEDIGYNESASRFEEWLSEHKFIE